MVNIYSRYVQHLEKVRTIFDMWALIAQLPKNSEDGTYHMVADQILLKLIDSLKESVNEEDTEMINRIVRIYMSIDKHY